MAGQDGGRKRRWEDKALTGGLVRMELWICGCYEGYGNGKEGDP